MLQSKRFDQRLLSEDENDPSPHVASPTWRPARRRSGWRASLRSRSRTMCVLQSSPKLDGWGQELQPQTLKGPGRALTKALYLIHTTGSCNYFSLHKQGNRNTKALSCPRVSLSEVLLWEERSFSEIVSFHVLLLKMTVTTEGGIFFFFKTLLGMTSGWQPYVGPSLTFFVLF